MATNKQRRETARRKLERQLEAREDRYRRRRRGNVVAGIVGAVAVVAVIVAVIVFTGGHGKSSNTAGSPATTPTSTAATTSATSATTAPATAKAAAAPYPCKFTKSGTAARKVTLPATTTPPRTGSVVLAVKSTQGPMTFTLNRSAGPCAVASVVSLVAQKYYDNTPCHRLVTSGIYVLQCGDPTGSGSGGPGYTVNDEYTGKESYTAGVIAMANTGAANSTGGQFFIIYKDSSAALGKTYTVIGKVTAGLTVVDKVAAGGSNNANGSGDGKPKLPISFTTVSITK